MPHTGETKKSYADGPQMESNDLRAVSWESGYA